MDWNLLANIGSPIVALLFGAWITRYIERRPQLTAYISHVSGIRARLAEDGPDAFVNTHTVVIRNSGKLKSSNVRVGHSQLPLFGIYPEIRYRVEDLEGSGKEIIFDVVVPEEQITITYLYLAPLVFSQINTVVRSDEGFAKILRMLPTPQRPQWQVQLAAVLIVIGAGAVLYALVEVGRRMMVQIPTP